MIILKITNATLEERGINQQEKVKGLLKNILLPNKIDRKYSAEIN